MSRYRKLLGERGVGPQLVEPLTRYAELLERWSRVHNLVRFHSPEELVDQHLMDALGGASALPVGRGLMVDVGSGAGLPGIPLLIAADDKQGLLVEPRQKRWSFLKTVVRELDLPADVACCRYQELGETVAIAVTARAVGGHPALAQWSHGVLSPGGRLLLWLGAGDHAALQPPDGFAVVRSAAPAIRRGRLTCFERCFT